MRKYQANKLADLGYTVIPIAMGEKYPKGIKNWEMLTNVDTLPYWDRSDEWGVGVLAANTPAIDVDIYDQKIADEFLHLMREKFGEFMYRVGDFPKFLIPCRTEEPFTKVVSNSYRDTLTEVVHRIEVLGDGNQYVMHHVHPKTRREYKIHGEIPPHCELPILTKDLAVYITSMLDHLAKPYVDSGVWELSSHSHNSSSHVGSDPLTLSPPDTIEKITKALLKLPPKDYDTNDTWLPILCAVHEASGGAIEAKEVFRGWCEQSTAYKGDLDVRWNSLSLDRSHRVTRATLYFEANKYDRPSVVTPKNNFDLLKFSEARMPLKINWLVENLLPSHGLTSMYGPSYSGKSYLALDLALSVAQGKDWMGFKIPEPIKTVYLAAEAGESLRDRLDMYGTHHNLVEVENLMVRLTNFNLKEEEALFPFEDFKFVIFDTFTAVAPGVDQNSVKEVSRMIDYMNSVKARTGGNVLFVHHTGKSIENGSRGSSAFRDAVDTEIEVMQEEKDSAVVRGFKIGKNRRGKDVGNLTIGFSFVSEDISVVVPSLDVPAVSTYKTSKPKKGGFGPNGETAKELILQYLKDNGTSKANDCIQAMSSIYGYAKKSIRIVLEELISEGLLERNDDKPDDEEVIWLKT